MKKSVFDLIRYANQLLFFGLMIALLGSVVFMKINDNLRQKQPGQGYDPKRNAPGVPMVNGATATESKTQPAKENAEASDYELDLVQRIDDVFIFRVSKDQIDTRVQHQNSSAAAMQTMPPDISISSLTIPRQRTVNLMFSRADQPSSMLLQRDALISQYDLKRGGGNAPLQTLNVYMIITEDTNSDQRLGRGDRIDLYSSAYDGSGLRLAIPDINGYQLIDDDRLLVTRNQNEHKQFYLLNLQSNEHSLLDTSFSIDRQTAFSKTDD
ncbi:MAG: hypothetical protein PF630_03735 [Gammaproteobacteria bacterium]|nr:hypothetical protein [Gammaproteobacteria bacterium]